LGGLPAAIQRSRACPPFHARVVKPRISTLDAAALQDASQNAAAYRRHRDRPAARGPESSIKSVRAIEIVAHVRGIVECGGGQAGAHDVNAVEGRLVGLQPAGLWGDFLGLAGKAEAAVGDRECLTIR
jgi:hypothetical protein